MIFESWVQTEMGNAGAKNVGMEKADTTVEDSVAGLMDKVSPLLVILLLRCRLTLIFKD
jgi:hypothetical protein